MKRSLVAMLQRLVPSEGGATAVLWALILLPVLLMAGFAIDYRRVISAQAHLQGAIDAAVLASALDYADGAFLPGGERAGRARDTLLSTFEAELSGSSWATIPISVDFAESGGDAVQGTVTAEFPMAFGGLFGRSAVNISAESIAEAARAQRVEIVLALDNTTSMFSSNRFNLMRSAAKGFVNDLFDAAETPGLTAIGVVPWATLVNINSERPNGFDASGAPDRSLGADGRRMAANAPFEDRMRYLLAPESAEPYALSSMEDDFAPVSWRGCVRAAPRERTVTGTGTVASALTDAPVAGMRWHAALVEPELRTFRAPDDEDDDDDDRDDDDDDDRDSPVVRAGVDLGDGRVLACTQRAQSGGGNIHLDASRACSTGDDRPVTGVADPCVSDPNEFVWFQRGGRACPWQSSIFPWTSSRAISGPNQNCPVAMLGLSEDRSQIIDKLDEMHPATGGTHMDLGLMWGLRMLSPRPDWARFFGHAAPGGYDDPSVRKVLILLSDGQNVPPGSIEGYYGCTEGNTRGQAGPCWRAPDVSRLDERSLNALAADACAALRDRYNVEVYTIAVDVTDGDALDLLAACAGDPARAFNIRAAELETVFRGIAERQLRLTR